MTDNRQTLEKKKNEKEKKKKTSVKVNCLYESLQFFIQDLCKTLLVTIFCETKVSVLLLKSEQIFFTFCTLY